MEFTIDAGLGQMLLAAAFAISCGLEARRLSGQRGAASARFPAWLALLAVLAAANWFALGRHPTQLVKTWDVQHAVLGAKYGPELGYFRLYECLLVFDAQGAGRWAGLPEVSDLREPRRRLRPADAMAGSDCSERFSAERREAFAADVDFFASLPRQPDPVGWFTDNGYNQSPFLGALLRPLLAVVPLSYGLLAALVWLDGVLMLAAFVAVARAFGATAGLLLCIYFFTSFSSQFALMGGSILRFGYLALLLLFASGMRTGRFAAAGVALALATLLQVFPAIYAAGLGIWAGWRWLKERSMPAWLAPGVLGFGVTAAAGLALSAGIAGLEAWPEFAEKMTLHSAQLSQYRVGLKLPFALVWPPAPGGALDYAEALAAVSQRFAFYAAAGAAFLLGALALAPRLSALGFTLFFGSVVLYVLTPVHYYFASLTLLFLVDAHERGETPAGSIGQALLFALSAGAFFAWRESDAALAWVNGYWLSPGIGVALAAFGLALFWLSRGQESRAARSS